MGADNEVLLDGLLAAGAGELLVQVHQEGGLFQRAVVLLGQGLLGPDQHIEDDARQPEDEDEDDGEEVDEPVAGAATGVLEGPDGQTEGEGGEVNGEDKEDGLEGGDEFWARGEGKQGHLSLANFRNYNTGRY